uniref:Uncharacterized protein n=1 Tax=Amorphochlora amoebiformis TaxID=1561963 RepID=A0A0H5BR05_9EUKA|nr:hypothetical protein [Amorphochlora amoebiformis]
MCINKTKLFMIRKKARTIISHIIIDISKDCEYIKNSISILKYCLFLHKKFFFLFLKYFINNFCIYSIIYSFVKQIYILKKLCFGKTNILFIIEFLIFYGKNFLIIYYKKFKTSAFYYKSIMVSHSLYCNKIKKIYFSWNLMITFLLICKDVVNIKKTKKYYFLPSFYLCKYKHFNTYSLSEFLYNISFNLFHRL